MRQIHLAMKYDVNGIKGYALVDLKIKKSKHLSTVRCVRCQVLVIVVDQGKPSRTKLFHATGNKYPQLQLASSNQEEEDTLV